MYRECREIKMKQFIMEKIAILRRIFIGKFIERPHL